MSRNESDPEANANNGGTDDSTDTNACRNTSDKAIAAFIAVGSQWFTCVCVCVCGRESACVHAHVHICTFPDNDRFTVHVSKS